MQVFHSVPERGGADGDVDLLPGHDDLVLLQADVEWRHGNDQCGAVVLHLDTGVEFKPSG